MANSAIITLFNIIILIITVFSSGTTAQTTPGYTILAKPQIYNIDPTLPVATASHFSDINYLPSFDVKLLAGITLTNPTTEKLLTIKLTNIFDLTLIPTSEQIVPITPVVQDQDDDDVVPLMEPNCEILVCIDDDSSLCIEYVLTPSDQATLNTVDSTLHVVCNQVLRSVSTDSSSTITSTIITNFQTTSPTVQYISSPDTTNPPLLFNQKLTSIPTFSIAPQLILPNIDFSYHITLSIPHTIFTTSPTDIPDYFTFALYTHYSAPFNITTCRGKNDNGEFSPLGVIDSVNVNSILIHIDPHFFIPIDSTINTSPYQLDLYFALHSPSNESFTSGGVMILYHEEADNINVDSLHQFDLPAITFGTSGIRIDYKLNQLTRWFLNQKQLNKIISITQRLLSSVTSQTTPTSTESSQTTITNPNNLKFACSIITLERFFTQDYPYPGASAGYWTIPTLSLYCNIASSSGQTTHTDDHSSLAYITQIYQSAVTQLWGLRDICESSVLWSMAHFNENIELPSPPEDEEEEEEEEQEEGGDGEGGDNELIEEVDDPAQNKIKKGGQTNKMNSKNQSKSNKHFITTANGENDDTPTVEQGPVIYPNGTIYDNTVLDVEWTSLQLFRIGLYELPTHCFNGIIDEDEVDVDCGGASCPLCGSGKQCDESGDDAGLNQNNNGGCIFTCIDGECTDNSVNNIFIGLGVISSIIISTLLL